MISFNSREYLKQFNFILGRTPRIESEAEWRNFVPEPYKSVFLLSADFELAWAWRYTKSADNPLEKALIEARQERINIPILIKLFEDYKIPVTWATVGHLFLENCNRNQGIPHEQLPRLNSFESEYWKYNGKDWFEHDPCTDYKAAPEWYCPDLIKQIINSTVKHEIGCHTFSHIDCSDPICPPDVFSAEIKECKKLATEWGLTLSSFVHPAHSIGNLDTLASEGFTNFRTDYDNILGYPKRHNNGLWELKQTTEFRYYDNLSIRYQINRYITIFKRAIKYNTVCTVWFHPSINPIFITKILPSVLKFIQENSDKILVTTHNKYINTL